MRDGRDGRRRNPRKNDTVYDHTQDACSALNKGLKAAVPAQFLDRGGPCDLTSTRVVAYVTSHWTIPCESDQENDAPLTCPRSGGCTCPAESSRGSAGSSRSDYSTRVSSDTLSAP